MLQLTKYQIIHLVFRFAHNSTTIANPAGGKGKLISRSAEQVFRAAKNE